MSNVNASSRKFTLVSTQSLIASRAIVRLSQAQAGETVRFHIVGNGTTIPVLTKDKQQVMDANTGTIPLTKTIYNVRANSQLAMMNTRNQEILRTAAMAEQQGDEDAAHAAFNDYLNKIQVSFSVINNPGRATVPFTDKQLVEGELEIVTTDNGQLVTVKNVRAVAVAKLGATPAFTMADLMGINDKPEIKADDVFTDDNKVGEKAETESETQQF